MLAQVNGTELFWEGYGSGRPMLLMHGGPGLDHAYFRHWLDTLGETVRLIYYDRRATGRSARDSNLDGVTLRTHVDDAEALRVHLGLERLVLFGHSFGACMALAYARCYGQRLDGLALCAAAPSFDHVPAQLEALAARASPEQRAMMSTAFSRPMANDKALEDAWRVVMPIYFSHYESSHWDTTLGYTRFSASAWNSLGQMANELSTNGKDLKADCPVLLLEGRHDWFAPEAQIQRLQAALPSAKLVRFAHSGHFPFVEEQGTFVDAMRRWIAALP